jgi:hypothetical protein
LGVLLCTTHIVQYSICAQTTVALRVLVGILRIILL